MNAQNSEVHQLLHPYGVGIDTHSKFIQVCVLRQVAQRGGVQVLRHEKSFTTHWNDLVAAHTWALGLVDKHADEQTLRYCIESTGTYHLPVLQAWRGQPSVVNPLLAGPTRRKTDVLDAQLLAHHSITGIWKASFVPTENCQQLRVLWAQRNEAKRAATRHSNRINNILLRFGHTFGADYRMRSAEAEGLIDDLCNGRTPKSAGISPAGLPEAMRPEIAALFERMQQAGIDVRNAEKTAVAFIHKFWWPTAEGSISGSDLLEILATVPGVGIGTAISWLAEVGDPRRFQHIKQVAAFCGCDPSLKVSAGKVTSHVRRAGNARLHQALLYAAQSVMQRQGTPLAQWGRSIAGRHKKGGYRKACGAVTRRIACSLWHVHRTGKVYDPSGYNFAAVPAVTAANLKDIMPARYLALLRGEKITTPKDLAEAFAQGSLAKIRGFGEKALEAVKVWIQSEREAKKPPHSHEAKEKKTYTLKNSVYEPKKGP